jgi:hypothetical protein
VGRPQGYAPTQKHYLNIYSVTRKLTRPTGASLGYPSPVTDCVLTRLVGSKSFPSVRSATRDTRPCLPSSGSPFERLKTGLGLTSPPSSVLCSAEPVLRLPKGLPFALLGVLCFRSFTDTLFVPPVRVPSSGSLSLRNLCANAWPACSPGTPFPGCLQGDKWLSQACPEALLSLSKGSQATPLSSCPALRPRWSPQLSPYRAQDCCLPPK